MELAPNRVLGHYRLVEKIGEGGMGVVWRATDTTLGREVAIKILPDLFAEDPDRLARFEREAKVLASLNHPGIATIHGLHHAEGMHFLAMELAPGIDLATRLAAGPIPMDEAIGIALKVAEALEAAHDHGIVHRDLKPANIQIAPDGRIKILDFGLAKAFDAEPGGTLSTSASLSPTLTTPAATRAGLILGTAAYMSPEQAKGKPVDRRADIWAFGCVLYEMIGGKRPFQGDGVSELIAAVIMAPVDFETLPKSLPARVRLLVRRCMEKDPRRRLRDIGEARLALEGMTIAMPLTPSGGIPAAPSSGPVAAASRTGRRVRPARRHSWIGDFARENPKLTVLVVAILAITLNSLFSRRSERNEATQAAQTAAARRAVPGLRVKMELTPDAPLLDLVGSALAISPDGRLLAFVTGEGGASTLRLRRLDQLQDTIVPESVGAKSPFFSPDGQWVGFFAGGKLKKAPVSGAAPTTICAVGDARGGAWSEADVIVIAPDAGTGLSKVSADGGTPEPLTALDAAARERSHRWPDLLPGGKTAIFMVQRFGQDYDDATIESVSLKSGTRKVLYKGGAFPRLARTGHLLFARRGVLNAVKLDDLEVKGAAQPVVQDLLTSTGNEALSDGSAQYAVSKSGALVYRTGRQQDREARLRLVDKNGAPLWTDTRTRIFFSTPRFSPDGTQLAFDAYGENGVDIFVHDLARHTETRLTFEANNIHPAWTPDGRYVTFASTRGSASAVGVGVFWIDAAGAGKPELLFGSDRTLYDRVWSRDGRSLVLEIVNEKTGVDLALLKLDGPLRPGIKPGEPEYLASTAADEAFLAISPDGRWLAFAQASDAGRMRIMVRPFPTGDGLFEVGDGVMPRWSPDGKTLYFQNLRRLYAASVTTGGAAPRFGTASPVFGADRTQSFFDVAPNGKGFLLVESAERSGANDPHHVVLALDWTEELKRLFEKR